MRNKINFRIVVLLILIIVISSIIYFFTNIYEKSYNKKIIEEKIVIDKILVEYDNFKKEDEAVINKRLDLYQKLNDFFSYYDVMKEKYDDAVKFYEEYDNLINELDKSSKYLLEKCNGYNYMSSDVIKICFAFKRNYEKTINFYVKDVNRFNKKIDEYNAWIKEEQSNAKLDKFIVKTQLEYIDVDKDNTYLGKIED